MWTLLEHTGALVFTSIVAFPPPTTPHLECHLMALSPADNQGTREGKWHPVKTLRDYNIKSKGHHSQSTMDQGKGVTFSPTRWIHIAPWSHLIKGPEQRGHGSRPEGLVARIRLLPRWDQRWEQVLCDSTRRWTITRGIAQPSPHSCWISVLNSYGNSWNLSLFYVFLLLVIQLTHRARIPGTLDMISNNASIWDQADS